MIEGLRMLPADAETTRLLRQQPVRPDRQRVGGGLGAARLEAQDRPDREPRAGAGALGPLPGAAEGRVRWIKAHDGSRWNEYADAIAAQEAGKAAFLRWFAPGAALPAPSERSLKSPSRAPTLRDQPEGSGADVAEGEPPEALEPPAAGAPRGPRPRSSACASRAPGWRTASRALDRARGARHPLPAARLALRRVVLARRRARLRHSVLPRASAPHAARAQPDARRRGRHARPSACGSCGTSAATRSSTPTSCTAAARWQRLFGNSSTALPQGLPPEPGEPALRPAPAPLVRAEPSRRGLRRDLRGLAQPRSDWRRRYAGWPALKKLEYVDELMAELGAAKPVVPAAPQVDPVCAARKTLREHYADAATQYTINYPDTYDRDLRRIFSDAPRAPRSASRRRPSCAATAREIRRIVARWTGEYQFTLDQVLQRHDRPLPRAPAPRGRPRTRSC